MEEYEDPTEHLHEKIHEEAHSVHSSKDKWIMRVALFTALVSVLAAMTGMLSGHHENEALISQIRASDQWAFYQAKGIKQEIVASVAKLMNKNNPDSVTDNRVEKYKTEQAGIKTEAENFEKDAAEHLSRHMDLARGVTLFQVSIAVSAISILTRRKLFWYIGIGFGIVACVFLVQGVI